MIPQAYFDKIKAYFNGDDKKAWLWWKTRNPAFGMFSPLDMLKLGRVNKVKQFIDNAIDENKRYYP
jgi:hypothetical protein